MTVEGKQRMGQGVHATPMERDDIEVLAIYQQGDLTHLAADGGCSVQPSYEGGTITSYRPVSR